MSLNRRRSFWGLIAAQFLGALNDNAFRAVVILLAIDSVAGADAITVAAAVVFVIPFIVFSPHAGRLADRYSKRSVIVALKMVEFVAMALGTVAFCLGEIHLLIAVLFLMAVQSAFFSPSKYGILPELVTPDGLPRANGILELSTFVAIILGQISGLGLYWARGEFALSPGYFGAIFCCLALLGWGLSMLIERVPAAAPDRRFELNPIPELLRGLRAVWGLRALRLAAIGIAAFWALAALLDLSLYFFGRELSLLQGGPVDGSLTTAFMKGALATGIGVGSLAAGYLSNQKPELGLVPIGTLGLGVFVGSLFFAAPWPGALPIILAILALLGFSAGLFIVPLDVLLQQEAPRDAKGRVIAGSNLLAYTGMLLSLGLLWLLRGPAGLDSATVYLLVGTVAVVATVFVFAVLPAAFFRFLFWLIVRCVYKIRWSGRENLPLTGPALLVSNHVSFVDGLLVLASTHRPIRFLVHSSFTGIRGLRWLARTLRVIPIASEDGPRAIISSLKEATSALENGELVCIFAEGQISRTGQLLPFRGGVERILRGVDAPVIPVYLDRVWGSIFSFKDRKFVWKVPSRIPYPVTICFGRPLPAETPRQQIRQAVQELGSDAFMLRKGEHAPPPWALVRYCRRRPFGLAVADSTGQKLSRGKLLVSTVVLARRLAKVLAGEPMIGLLLPPSVGGCVANFAASLLGKPVVNFNYTIGPEALESAAEQCGIRKVLSSRQFLDKLDIDVPGEAIFLEDLRGEIAAAERLLAIGASWTLPGPLLRRFLGARRVEADDTLTVIFSSGSTGEPKGVELSHFNILSNVQAISQGFNFRDDDRLLGVLPFFHSTGYTATLWTPLLVGIGVVYHPNPLDARAVGHLARTHACTTLVATPTFLQGYMRRCRPEDFGSLRHVVVGAEKLGDAVRDGFRERFGLEPQEGYGSTECSPLVSLNVPDFRGPGFHQVGTKRGIGHPLPGVSVRIVDPDSFQPRGVGEEGLLLVKGPNVMKGYLGRPERTAEVIRDSWYITGDIASMDEDGFLTLTDRLSRFAKIGGEMVPHLKVEEALNGLIGSDEKRLVVTSIPDSRKGERLVVIHVLDDEELQAVRDRISDAGLPNLWVPRSDSFVHVDEIPILGTGKIDIRRVRDLALDRLARSQRA